MKKVILLILALSMLLITSCEIGGQITTTPGGNTTPPYKTVTPRAVKALLDKGSDITIVDVRRIEEYEERHIPSAINIPSEAIGTSPVEGLDDLGASIIIYSRDKESSKDATKRLLAIGYTNVKDLGSCENWTYETVSGPDAGVWTPPSAIEKPGILGNFTSTTIDDQEVDETIFVDYKLTMVNVWATYCGPCLNEMPDLGEIAEEYKDKGVQIVGIVLDVLNSSGSVNSYQIQNARSIAEATGANYLHIIPSRSLNSFLNNVTAVPTTIFVDENGKQVGIDYIGSRTKEQWMAIIDELLAEVEQ